MSTNPYYHYMLNVAGVPEKEPYFQRAWGRVNILSRQRDRQIHKDLRGSNFELQNSHSKSILNSFNSMTIENDQAALLEDLANQALNFIEEEQRQARQRVKEEILKCNAIQTYIAEIVETLSPYAGLVNTAVGHTELYTVLTGPEVIVEQIKLPGAHDSFEYRKDFRARFSTRTWSLLFRGVEGRLDIFLLPADKVLRLSKVESFYKPLAKIYAEAQESGIVWTVDGVKMNAQQRMAFILQLFHQLIDRTKCQMFKERARGAIFANEILDLTQPAIRFDESDDTRDFDYRKGQPELFQADETANSSSAVEPAYVEAAIAENVIVAVADFNQSAPQYVSQYLLTESDFADIADEAQENRQEPGCKAGKVLVTAKKPPSKTAKSRKRSKAKGKGASSGERK